MKVIPKTCRAHSILCLCINSFEKKRHFRFLFCNLYERRNEMKVNYQLEGKEQKHHNINIKLNRNYIKQDLQHEL